MKEENQKVIDNKNIDEIDSLYVTEETGRIDTEIYDGIEYSMDGSPDLTGLAVRSLIFEAGVSPKPGLVDFYSNGSHEDMDYDLFLLSARSLERYFRTIAHHYRCIQNSIEDDIFMDSFMIDAGIIALNDMMKATGGVNTHKGAIFTLGLIMLSLLHLESYYSISTDEEKLQKLREILARNSSFYFSRHFPEDYASNGQLVRRNHGVGSVIKESTSGYPSIFLHGIPSIRSALDSGFSMNRSLLTGLLAMIIHLEDSNLLRRGGTEGERLLKSEAERILTEAGTLDNEKFYREILSLDRECVRRNLSPGGAADLLAASILIMSSLKMI